MHYVPRRQAIAAYDQLVQYRQTVLTAFQTWPIPCALKQMQEPARAATCKKFCAKKPGFDSTTIFSGRRKLLIHVGCTTAIPAIVNCCRASQGGTL